eukprot:11785_1
MSRIGVGIAIILLIYVCNGMFIENQAKHHAYGSVMYYNDDDYDQNINELYLLSYDTIDMVDIIGESWLNDAVWDEISEMTTTDNAFILKKCFSSWCACQSFRLFKDFGVYSCDVSTNTYNANYNDMNDYYYYNNYEAWPPQQGDEGILIGNFETNDKRSQYNGEWVKIMHGSSTDGWEVENQKHESIANIPTANLIYQQTDETKQFKVNDFVKIEGRLPPTEDIITVITQKIDDLKIELLNKIKSKVIDYFNSKSFTWYTLTKILNDGTQMKQLVNEISKYINLKKGKAVIMKLIRLMRNEPPVGPKHELFGTTCVITGLFLPSEGVWPVKTYWEEKALNIQPRYLSKLTTNFPFFYGVYRPPINMVQDFNKISKELKEFYRNHVEARGDDTFFKKDEQIFESKWKKYIQDIHEQKKVKKNNPKDESPEIYRLSRSEAFIIHWYMTQTAFCSAFRKYWWKNDNTIKQNEVMYMLDAIWKALHNPNRLVHFNDHDLFHGTKADITGITKKQKEYKKKKNQEIKRLKDKLEKTKNENTKKFIEKQIQSVNARIQQVRGPMSFSEERCIAKRQYSGDGVHYFEIKKERLEMLNDAQIKVMGFLPNHILRYFAAPLFKHEMEYLLSDFDASLLTVTKQNCYAK